MKNLTKIALLGFVLGGCATDSYIRDLKGNSEVYVFSPTTDPYLCIKEADGTIIAENDDSSADIDVWQTRIKYENMTPEEAQKSIRICKEAFE